MRRWLLPLACVAAAIACATQAVTGGTGTDGAGAAGAATSVPATPVLSLRRLPAAAGELVADRDLGRSLDAAFADPAVAGTQSCIDVEVAGAAVYTRGADEALMPASNLKLLTAYAALSRLGPDTRFTTAAVAARAPAGGVVAGPLYLIGGGDPLLATAAYRPSQTAWTESAEPVTRLEDLADRIKAAGITRISGPVTGDDTRYDAVRTLPSWKASYVSTGEIGPVGALEVNGGFVVSGRRRVAAAAPALAAAAALTGLLQQRGIVVGGAPAVGPAPPGASPVAVIQSLPLSAIVGEMLRESDNLAAEMLTKELGHRFGGAGSWPAGVAVTRATVAAAGVPLSGYAVVDGSGLDRSDRLTCRTLQAVMDLPGRATAIINASLPTAGDCGTLVQRFVGQAAAGRVRAKTGSLIGVAALTGFVEPESAGRPACPPGATDPPAGAALHFATVVNGVPTDAAGAAVEDRLAAALVTYPQTPVLDPFGPLP